MLKKVLKLDQVHMFGDVSKSQLVEKVVWVTEKTIYNQLNSTHPHNQTLIIIISLAKAGLFAETDQELNYKHDMKDEQDISISSDSTMLYKNIS